MSLRILFVEDEESTIAEAKECLQETLSAECQWTPFEDVEGRIHAFRPDVIVLDIFAGDPSDENDDGVAILNNIWSTMFRPIVVYSARPSAVQDSFLEHPFLKFQQKGSGSDMEIAQRIQEFQPHIQALRGVDDEIGQTIQNVLREVAPFAFDNPDLEEPARADYLVRAARRRVAALMDEKTSTGVTALASWEQYLYPPCVTSLLVCDLLRERTADQSDPSAYRVILTPSCDLVSDEGRKPKVEHVLVAACTNAKEFVRNAADCQEGTSKPKKIERVRRILPQGYKHAYVPLPGLPGVWPEMAVSFRQLDVISIESIASSASDASRETAFVRVASIDSPFREMIAWAFTHFAGRPGLPERDFDSWANKIVECATEE